MGKSELDPEIYGTKPEEAKRRLEFLGYTEDTYDRLMSDGIDGMKFGSHEVRALVIIAQGSKPRFLGDVYKEIRIADGLPPERPT